RLEDSAGPSQRDAIRSIRRTQDQVMATVARIAALIRDNKADEAMDLHLSEGYPLYREIATQVTRAVRAEEAGMGRIREGVEATSRRALLLTGGFAAASIVLALGLGFVISWSFILPVREAEGFLGEVAKGDFGGSIEVPNRDEFGSLARQMNEMSRGLHQLYDEQGRAAPRRPPGGAPHRAAGAGQPRQVRLPGQHEPRAAHADERDPRLHRDDPRRAVRRDPAGHPGAGRGHPHVRQAAPRPHQQRARPLQDRGGPHGAGPERIRGRGRGEYRQALAARPGREQGARAGDHGGPRPAALPGRRQADHSVPDEPGRERAEVHRRGAGGDPGGAGGRPPALRGGRHRNRHRRGSGRAHLRGVPPGRRHRDARLRRDRARAGDHEKAGGAARRPHLGAERAGQGLDFHLHDPGASDPGGARVKTVLYVEDNEFNRKIVRQLLGGTSYRLIEATAGEAGVSPARAERPDLIIMDIQLPKLSGLEATRQLKAAPETADVPIIVITSFALAGDEQKARDAGAAAYLAKPYSPRELLGMIRDLAPE